MPCSDHAVLLKATAQHGRRESAMLCSYLFLCVCVCVCVCVCFFFVGIRCGRVVSGNPRNLTTVASRNNWPGLDLQVLLPSFVHRLLCEIVIIPYPTAFPYGNGMVLHFYQQQESSTTKTVHKVINKGQNVCIVASHW